jgi:hypothetical protein
MVNKSGLLNVFAAKATTGTGTAHKMESYDRIFFRFGSAASANLTVKFQVSMSNAQPDFSASQSATNHWDYVDVIDAQNGASIDGDTGVALTGTDDFRLFEANAGAARWVCATITARSAGNLTLDTYGVTYK